METGFDIERVQKSCKFLKYRLMRVLHKFDIAPVWDHAKATQSDLSADFDHVIPKPSFFELFRGELVSLFVIIVLLRNLSEL